MNSSKLRGRLSNAHGSRNPCSTSVSFRERRPRTDRALGYRDVGLVDHDEVVLREVVEQRVGTLPRLSTVEVRACSSRCRRKSPFVRASRGRARCASEVAGLRAACPRTGTSRVASAVRLRYRDRRAVGSRCSWRSATRRRGELLHLAATLLGHRLKNETSSMTFSKNETRIASLL